LAAEGARDELLFVGDIHLGRRPVGLDAALELAGVRADALSPAAAWRSVVEYAIEQGVRAVVLAGDVVDHEKDRFEALTLLQAGVADLAAAGIPVYGVAGNHDGLVLPKLAARVESFTLLGEEQTWERSEIPGEGRDVDLVGWSFAGRHVTHCPLDDAGFAEALGSGRPGAALLGVLHCDLDQAKSAYAPVPRSRLAASEANAWFLGHVHQPADLTVDRPIG